MLRRSGGFANLPALTGQFVVDTETLVQRIREEVESLAEAVNFTVATQSPAFGSADHINYELTIVKDDVKASRVFTGPISDPDVERLITRLEQLARGEAGR